MIPQDYHMHSNFSCDCQAPMATMCRSAISKGIPEIGFSEHFDLHANEPFRDWFRPSEWWEELERCRSEFAGQLTIRAGIEVGEPHLFGNELQQLLSTIPFDYVLGSLHWVGSESVFHPSYFHARTKEKVYDDFFEELIRMTAIGGFDILSHFDVPIRTAFAIHGPYNPRRHEEAIRQVLRNCIEHGIALDLNTAALRRTAKVLTPAPEILAWYAELGGERVTLGSDAHNPDDLGAHLPVAMQLARTAGLRYLTHFTARQATLLPIPN
jgi:histidinol-phosphatase (PHP family)